MNSEAGCFTAERGDCRNCHPEPKAKDLAVELGLFVQFHIRCHRVCYAHQIWPESEAGCITFHSAFCLLYSVFNTPRSSSSPGIKTVYVSLSHFVHYFTNMLLLSQENLSADITDLCRFLVTAKFMCQGVVKIRCPKRKRNNATSKSQTKTDLLRRSS